MGKAIRWLKALFRKQSCIGRSRRDPNNSPAEASLLKSVCNNHSEEQSKRAIEVAAATAAAADAAIAAIEAAVALVRLTSRCRRVPSTGGARENSAAIKIQALFRGYLSRKALKALKSVVKLQAVVRGYLVRKEAAQTLYGMEALFRAQSSVCAQRFCLQDHEFNSNFRPRRSIKRANETRSRRISPSLRIPIDGRSNPVAVDLEEPKSRLTRANTCAWTPDSGAQAHFYSNPHHRARDPSFMANTKSFRAKVRSYSARKQRPDSGFGLKKRVALNEMECGPRLEKSKSKSKSHSAPKQGPDSGFGLKKRVALNKMECGPRLEKSKSPSLEVNNFKNFVMSRIGRFS